MNYVQIMRSYIDDYGLKEFTHHDIITLTNTNCPHGVLRQLKNYYEMEETLVENNYKRFKKYKVLKAKEKRKLKCQKV